MSPRILHTLLLAASMIVSTACTTSVTEEDASETSSDPSTDPNPDPEPTPQDCQPTDWDGTLEVGGGETCFEAIESGQTRPLIAGPQFGYHIWMGLRCRDCDRSEVVGYGIKDADGNFVAGQSQSASLVMKRIGDHRYDAGIQAYMPGDGFEDPPYLGESFTFWVEMDINGEMVSDEVTVVVDDIEYWSPPCDDPEGCELRN